LICVTTYLPRLLSSSWKIAGVRDHHLKGKTM
jgi:hypothetical protein